MATNDDTATTASDIVEKMRRILIAAPIIALVAAACTDTGSYKDQTEDFLNDDSDVSGLVGGDVSDAECEEPDSTDVGEEYQCTVQVEGVGTATFDILIDKEDSFSVNPNFELTGS